MHFLTTLMLALLIAGCASTQPDDRAAQDPTVVQAGEHYKACVFAAADKRAQVPAAAEDIAAAAEGDCRAEYLKYADLMRAPASAQHTPAENQLANDKADAQLRAFQTDLRRLVVERISLRSLTRGRGQASEASGVQ